MTEVVQGWGATPQEVNTTDQVIKMLLSGRIDAAIASPGSLSPQAPDMQVNDAIGKFVMLPDSVQVNEYFHVLSASFAPLAPKIAAELKRTNGEFQAIIAAIRR